MLFEKNCTQDLDRELFQKPTAEYRAVPFWSWNCRITKELIDSQLCIFRKMGFGGVDIHPRSGMDTVYLSEEYQELVKYTVQKCEELGLACWLYDEDRFPSGSAGGIVTQNYRFRGRFLLLTRNRRSVSEGFYEDRQSFENAIDDGKGPKGYYAAAYEIALENGYLKDYKRLETEDGITQALENGNQVRYAYVELLEEEAWFEDQAYVDTMNPEAVREFIRVTHEAYYKNIGEEFGAAVPAIFTDEPRMGKHSQLRLAQSQEDVTLPYTDYLAKTMREQYGMDPLDIVPEYVWNLTDGRFSVNRYRYRNLSAECFVRAFMDQICEWCNDHNIYMTGHVLSEETLGSQVFALGDCMRCYRRMDLPGIDILADRKEFATAKQAVSVARQNGKEGVVSELYGVTHWDCTFKTFKLQGDWQAALGISIRIPHLSHMSLEGEAKRDWPGSIFFHAPWYEEYPFLEDYFSRLNTVLTRGRAIVPIGVVHPVESVWMHMGPDDQTGDLRREMDEDFARLIRWLLFGTLDFDFLSEALLPRQCRAYLAAPAERLGVGQMEYSAVLVPNMVTIRSTTLDILEACHRKGGKIIFMGNIPVLVDGQESDRAQRLAAECICIGKSRKELFDALEEVRQVEIRQADGTRSDNLFCQMRQDNACRWLFICHVNEKKQHISREETYTIRIRGSYSAIYYDALTGETKAAASARDGKDTILECRMYAQDSVLYRLEEDEGENTCRQGIRPERTGTFEAEGAFEAAGAFETVEYLSQIDDCRRQEYNVLLLDYARYGVDDGPVQEREEILRLDNKIRKQLGFVLREDRMNQPYHLKEKETHKVTLYYTFESTISVQAYLAVENPDSCRIRLNGQEAEANPQGFYVDPSISVLALPDLAVGENELILEVDYHQKTNLENLFLLGDFDVDLSGSHPVVVRKRGRIFLGDITGQGMPFYTGNLEYVFHFTVEDEDREYYVQVPRFKAPLLKCSVDGESRGLIAYAPHRQKLGRLEKGIHELKLCLYGNRFNGFGTLHNPNSDYTWYGPDSYRTRGDDWTDCYEIRPVGILSKVEIQKA